ncbi:MAG: hypothetical protein IKD69_14305 [Solobacterium sp.]|nr:hypothetical protein [Solobacterium sp.]
MKRAFINARIHGQSATAFIVEYRDIIALGSDEQVLAAMAQAGEKEIVDLRGMYVVPGFVLCGLSLYEYGYRLAHTIPASFGKEEIEQFLQKEEGTDVILYGGSNDLTEADLSGLNRKVRIIQKDRSLSNTDEALSVPYEKYLARGYLDLASKGVTSVLSNDFAVAGQEPRTVLQHLETALKQDQAFAVRIHEMLQFEHPDDYAAFLDQGYVYGDGYPMFEIGHLYLPEDLEDPYLMSYLAARFNTPFLARADDESQLENVLKLYDEVVDETNFFHSGIITDIRDDRIAAGNYMRLGHDPLEIYYADRCQDPLAVICELKKQGYEQNLILRSLCEKPYTLLDKSYDMGAITVGRAADFTVLSDVEIDENTRVMYTMTDGRTVFER